MPKVTYRCTSCNWKFSRSEKPSMCSYCGKPSLTEDKPIGADQFIREIEQAEQAFAR